MGHTGTWLAIAILAVSPACKKKSTGVAGRSSMLAGVRGDAPFTPSKEGFRFANYGNEEGFANLTAREVARMFGPAACASGDAATCILTPAAKRWMDETNKAMSGGHCEGFAAVSLLMRLGKLVAKDFGADDPYDLAIADNPKLQREIAYWFATQFVAPMSGAEIRTLTPVEVADRLAEAFESGKDSYTLGIYQPDGSLGHATTPYAVVQKSPTETWIMHYDSNFPGEERHIDVDRATNTWKYFTPSNPAEPGAVYAGGAETHSLTIAPTSVRLGTLQCPFCGDVDAADSSGGSREIILDGDADLLVTDDTGKRTGHLAGKLVNEIAGANIVEVKSAAGNRDHEPIYNVPGGHALKLEIDGSQLAAAAMTDLSMIGPGYTMGVYGIQLAPNEKDEVAFSADWSDVSYTTPGGESPELELGIETSGADFVFDIHAAAESGGQRIDLSVDVAAGTVAVAAVAHDGAGTYDVEIHRIDASGDHVFRHAGLSVGAADRFRFRYADWTADHQKMHVGIDHGGDGSIDEQLDLDDED